MAGPKTILVVGATGAQGGSVARHLLAAGRHRVKALTRKPESQEARALRSLGAQVARGELADRKSLTAAVAGCDAVFGVTDYWEHFEREYEQGKNLADAVAAARTPFFVLSTLPSVRRVADGELKVPHFETKARIEEYSRGLGLPAAYAHVAFYYENFLTYFAPKPRGDGSFTFGFPQGDTRLAMVAAEDMGGVIAPMFERPADFIGQTIGIVGDDLPVRNCAETMSRVLGKRIIYQHISRETFAGLDFPGADDLADMFDFNRRFVPNRRADLERSRTLYPGLRRFELWLIANRDRFESVLAGGARAGAH
jgi:uncharacterized protein YbjT (DUF2867 family)